MFFSNLIRKRTYPLVSIIIPFWNTRATLASTIQSVINNSYSNFEMIIVDDGSPESADDIIQSYKDPRIKFYKKENEGLGLTRNFGIYKSSGKYVFFLDSDDEIFRDSIIYLVNYAESNNLKVVSGITVRHYIDTGREEKWFHHFYKEFYINEMQDRIPLYNDALSTNKLYLKNFLIDNNILYEPGLYEDKLFTAKLYSKVDRIGMVPKEIYLWNIYGANTSISQSKNLNNFLGRMASIEKLWHYLPDLRKFYQISFFINHDLLIYIREFNFFSKDEKNEIFIRSRDFIIKNKAYIYERLIPKSSNYAIISALVNDNLEYFLKIADSISLEYYSGTTN